MDHPRTPTDHRIVAIATAAALAALAATIALAATPTTARAGDADAMKDESLTIFFERCVEPTESARKIAAVQWDNLLKMGYSAEAVVAIARTLPTDCAYVSFKNAILAWERARDRPALPAAASSTSREGPWCGQGYRPGGGDGGGPSPSDDPPLTNADVLKLHAAGLSASVIAAKVAQAPDVDFDLDVDTLLELKDQGLPDPVVEAMLAASGRSAGEPAGDEPPDDALPDVTALRVWLDADDRDRELRGVRGRVEEEYLSLKVVFDGTKTAARTDDDRPSLYVAYPVDPTGLAYLSEAEVDRNEDLRWCGVENPMSYLSWKDIPVPDDGVRLRVEQAEPGLWRLTLRDDLERGEQYALWIAATEGGRVVLQVFDFEVE